jgi:polyisoprenoid-binding protein YceI
MSLTNINARTLCVVVIAVACWLGASAAAQQVTLNLDPAQTVANFTATDPIHTVHGSFALKRGEIRFDPPSGKVEGEIVFDATSGKTGNDSRDHKMHKDVLESAKYPEITFKPDHYDGKVAEGGASSVQVHGMFGIHGTEHQMTIPVEVTLAPDKWNATTKFVVPYAKWGMPRPRVAFIVLGENVDIDLRCAGTLNH